MVVHDLHPDYFSTQFALSLDLPKLAVQHHYAHAASVMAEHDLSGPVIGVSLDGTGYGIDGAIWGGEFLIADYCSFERKGHLKYIPMPGGEQAIKEPWRMALVWLERLFGPDFWDLGLEFLNQLDREKTKIVLASAKAGVNAPLTSSMGRLFDAVSALINLCLVANYEGQPAIELEMIGEQNETASYHFSYLEEDGKILIDPEPVISRIVEELGSGQEPGDISARFHNGASKMVVEVCEQLRERTGINQVTVSGGVFQNFWLLSRIKSWLEEQGFKVYAHRLVPPNDGGICLGQAAIGLRRIKDVLGSSNEG